MTHSEIVGSTTVMVSAGGETTAAAITGITYYMLKNREILKKAQEEVRSSFNSLSDITTKPVENLTYLNAIIEEGLRMYPPNPASFARRTKKMVEVIDGYEIPPNVRIPWPRTSKMFSLTLL